MDEIENLTNRIQSLENLLNISRKDQEFDLFYQRFTMAERLINFQIENFSNITMEDWYPDYWKVAGKCKEITKFAIQEHSIMRQIIELTKQEKQPIRMQCLALSLVLFNKIELSKVLIDKKIWSENLKDDFETFEKWIKLSSDGDIGLKVFQKIMKDEKSIEIKNMLKEKYSHIIKIFGNCRIILKNILVVMAVLLSYKVQQFYIIQYSRLAKNFLSLIGEISMCC